MRPVRLVAPLALGAAAGLSLAACGSAASPKSQPASHTASTSSGSGGGSAPGAAVTLSEAGSSLLYPLFQIWAPAYHRANPKVTVSPAAGGSGKGISGAIAGTLAIGASDAYLSPAQRSAHPDMANIPLAISAQMVNYNLPGGPRHLKLNGRVLQGIYEGKITAWDDPAIAALNPGAKLPATKIVPLHRSDSSGDTFLFTQYLSKANPGGWGKTYHYNTTWPGPAIPGALGQNGNGGMVTGCSHTPGCIAYVGISYKNKTDAAGLGEAKLANASGHYLLPTSSAIVAEAKGYAAKTPANEAISLIYGPAPQGYPIINYEYAIVSTTGPSANQAAAMRAFLGWASNPSKGSSTKYLSQVGFQPLPPQVVSLSRAQIRKIK